MTPRALLCRVLGHRYGVTLTSPGTATIVCERCDSPMGKGDAYLVAWETTYPYEPGSLKVNGRRYDRTPRSQLTRPASWSERLSRPAIERAASRPGSADTEAPVPEGTQEGSTPPRDRTYVPGIGVVEWSRLPLPVTRFGSPSSTGAPVHPDSSTSTPTPSNVSRRSAADSSR